MTKLQANLAVLLCVASATGAWAQTTPASPKHASKEQQVLDQMDQRIQKLEQMVTQLQQQLQARDKDIAETKARAAAAQAEAQATTKQERLRAESTLETVAKNSTEINDLKSTVATLKAAPMPAPAAPAATVEVAMAPATAPADMHPDAIHFLGISLIPGGFLAGETVSRQHALGGDVNTGFNALPFSGQTAADFSEFNGSGRQSRFSLMGVSALSSATLRGYYEADFLSAGITSNSNESNSYTLRQRQVWAQAALHSGWTFTGGQMWSLATETRSGLMNNTEAVPRTIDAQYNVGFTWERQYGFRVTKAVNDKVTVGMSVEQPQTLNIGGHNLPAIVYQQPGNTSGLYNSSANYSYNFAPDLIAKIAYEPGFGHFEIYGVGRFFRARVFPNAVSLNGATVSTTPTAGAYTSKTQGGGLGVNARVPLFDKKLEVGLHFLGGNGLGRYSTSTLADATEHADGSLELLPGGSALGSLEWHATPKLDLYAYYGGEYVKRAFYPTGLSVLSGTNVGQPILSGYGAPTNDVSGCHTEVAPVTSSNGGGYVPGAAAQCLADNRNIQEGTFGYWYTFYRGSKGMLQQGIQYSYAVRHTWQGIGNPLSGIGGSPKAIDNMWFTSFRFYLPQPEAKKK